MSADQADSGWDSYNERVLRNEGQLRGLESLVAETRAADRQLIEQRSESLARELERRAESVEIVTRHDREADLREFRDRFTAHVELVRERLDAHVELVRSLREADQRRDAEAAVLLREMYDDKLESNFDQSQERVNATDAKVRGDLAQITERVNVWRASDREAREIQATEYARRLDELNHAHERQENFQTHAVTRELWQAEKDAQANRDGVTREQINALEKAQLLFTPQGQSDKTHKEITVQCEALVSATRETLEEKLSRIDERVNDLRTQQNVNSGRLTGSSVAIGWVVAGITLLVSIVGVVVVLANVFTG